MNAHLRVQWQYMEVLIGRAKQTCINLGKDPEDQFEVFDTSVKNPKLGGRPGLDVHMTRYGCYITALCGDAHKKEVAAARHYFASMTRAQELARQSPARAVHADPIPGLSTSIAAMRRERLARRDHSRWHDQIRRLARAQRADDRRIDGVVDVLGDTFARKSCISTRPRSRLGNPAAMASFGGWSLA